MKIITSAICFFALVSCTQVSVSTPATLSEPVFEVHVLRGSIRYLGGEYVVDLEPGQQLEVPFNLPVRDFKSDPRNQLQAAVHDGNLVVHSSQELGPSGEVVWVALYDSRMFPVRFLTAPQTLDSQVRASALFEEPESINARRKTQQEINRFLSASILADKSNIPVSGIKADYRFRDILAVDSAAIRATMLKSYVGEHYVTHVLEVENKSDLPQEIDPSIFHFKKLKKVKIEQPELPARVALSRAPQHKSKVYVVVAG